MLFLDAGLARLLSPGRIACGGPACFSPWQLSSRRVKTALIDTNDGAFLSFEVTEEQEGMPLVSYLRSAFGMSRAMIRRLRKDASVKADGIPVPMRHRLRRGERITLHVPPGLMSNVEPEPSCPGDLLRRSPSLGGGKARGPVSHPAHSEFRGTLANGVAYHLLAQGEPSTAGRSHALTAIRRVSSFSPSTLTPTTGSTRPSPEEGSTGTTSASSRVSLRRLGDHRRPHRQGGRDLQRKAGSPRRAAGDHPLPGRAPLCPERRLPKRRGVG